MTICTGCGQDLPSSSFTPRKEGGKKHVSKCKSCRSRAYRDRYSPDDLHEHKLKAVFGIDRLAYTEMLSAQGGLCAICRQPPGKQRLSVDHDHLTGTIRALLCQPCNTGLGLFKESTALLAGAIQYLERERVEEPLREDQTGL